MLGELFASQLHHHIVSNVFKAGPGDAVAYVGRTQVGDFLREDVFAPGAVYHWNDMIERATGDPLAPKYFVDQFVK